MINKIDLIYKELTYSIIGCFYDVCNKLGSGLKEKHYQKALEQAFQEKGLVVKREIFFPIKYNDNKVGSFYFDFLINEKIVVEIKAKNKFNRKDIDQLFSYLKLADLKLGLLVYFTEDGVRYKRIVNLKNDISKSD